MENSFQALVESSKNAIKFWWLIALVGVAIFVVGFLSLIYPAAGFLGMSVLFGWVILFSGIAQIVMFATSKHVITGRGWMLAGGIIETILGLVLIWSIELSAVSLPIFLGFWLLFRGFSMVGLGGDMKSMGIDGGGWTIFTAILLIILAFIVLMQPFIFGVQMVVAWVGISFLFAGASLTYFAFHIRRAHKAFESKK